MELTIRLSGTAAPSDELRSLQSYLLGEDELQGRVRATEVPAQEGALGPVLEALQIVGGSAGVASVVVTWIKSRHGKFTATISRADGSKFVITHQRVRSASKAEMSELTEQVAKFIEGHDAAAEHEDGGEL